MRPVLAPIAAALMLAACSSAPKVATPTGSHRVPINDDNAIAAYDAQRAREDDEAQRRSALQAKIAELERQRNELKAYILKQAEIIERNRDKGKPPAEPVKESTSKAPSKAPDPTAAVTPAAEQAKVVDAKLVEVRDNSILFTVTHSPGQASFAIPDNLVPALVETAKTSQAIEIRGRTDAVSATPADRQIALLRAQNAYWFLVKKGVPAKNIKVTFFSAGHFAVDNSTPEGKARNRRVEIELVGADVGKFKQRT